MEYNLRTAKNNEITNTSGIYYNYAQYITHHYGTNAVNKIIQKTQAKYTQIWNITHNTKLFQIFSHLIYEQFHKIFTKGLFNIHHEVFEYFCDPSNFINYQEWYDTFYDVLRNAENNYYPPHMQPHPRLFIMLIGQFHALHEIEVNQHYNNKKIFVRTAIIMAKVKIIRSLHLFVNRNYYKIFSFSIISILKTIHHNTFKHINDITTFIIPSGHFDIDKLQYLNLAITTFKKGSHRHSHFIGSILNRLFCKDIALYICHFI